jgi:hypothetical protein
MAKRSSKKEENIFVKAKQNAKVEPKQEGTVEIPGLRRLAALNIVIKALDALKTTEETAVKTTLKETFVKRGMELGHQPKNFTGVEGDASANCQCKKRSSRSSLTDEEVTLLEKFKIAYKKDISQPEAYTVNEKYVNDQEILKRVSKLLIKAGLEDFITLQSEKFTFVTTEVSIEEVFNKIANTDDVSMLLEIVATLAMKFTEDGDTAEAFKIVMEEVLSRK